MGMAWLQRIYARLYAWFNQNRKKKTACTTQGWKPKIEFDEQEIRWRFPDDGVLRLRWENVGIIGFETNDQGPFYDDWFLIFFNKQGERYIVTLCEAWPGSADLLGHIVSRPGVVLGEKSYLAHSGDNDSVIVWPPELAGNILPEETYDVDKKVNS